ncbi:MAG: bifunctional DNA primase/polymerase [Chloroflexi bacterium]|nr:bifunctional DNA primase/polymerase [Chloroflexota bacterium]MCY3582542.1 bifunctional DNA primase/polymerase [Chloroflexota bacterium]MCY3715294.1 bifunctional DNA primase/polymerase [Chloroflexota bacterium]MDE2650191.1 bifunctional DNA primase/polymerase [Chloroflexota bacterium]MYA93307.1 bifunctional DNA primase/polymerase [Chloroflexota bacterium]
MKFLPNFRHKSLLNEAKKLADSGYSVIPVHGDNAPDEPKKPAIRWRQYQKRIASHAEIDAAFDKRFTALGIVCGRVSRLLVIDFDDQRRYRQFCMRLPQYADTYSVKTRRGCHLYFRSDELVPSHQFAGGDIKGERSYVLAPPSQVGDFTYRAMNALPAIQLQRGDIDKLLNYFHVNSVATGLPGGLRRQRSDMDVARVYARLAGQIGRNNALYRAAAIAREQGMALADVEKCLVPLHVEQPAKDAAHRREKPVERLLEAQRSIASAFRGGSVARPDQAGIPNAVRERLLTAQGSSIMPRFLDALYLAGWKDGAAFTLSEAVDVARRVGLSRKSVLQALTGDRSIFNGRHIISRRYVEYLDNRGLNLKKRGRPVKVVFQAPSAGRLLAVLNVRWTPSDALCESDLRTAKSYRQALHRAYIQRLNPQLPMRNFADRLGASTRTIRRYNHDLGVQITACISRLQLAERTVRCLPRRTGDVQRNATAGYWLEAAAGARYPAWRHIGAKLLKEAGKTIWLCIRRASRYSLAAEPAPAAEYTSIRAAEFLQLRVWRGETVENPGLRERAMGLLRRAKERVVTTGYQKLRLSYSTVAERIADDKIAETINGYLYALDERGQQLRRPARRGIAYRMLKEFGEGNVFLALRDTADEVLVSLARGAERAATARESP